MGKNCPGGKGRSLLDTLLINVRGQALISSIYTSNILVNKDPYCLDYLKSDPEKKILV
ncbi:MAG: hypothetical protein KG012_17630 [Deltaproteobacteria bacterium]|nr:hypothetical protein [Deltaproteobacteria bacterium]